MIKLINLKIENEQASCAFYLEDCIQEGTLICNSKGEIIELTVPKGYEWCKKHVSHARDYLMSLFGGNDVPEEKVLMWC